MIPAKNDMIAKLRRDLLLLQGHRSAVHGASTLSLGSLNNAFPEARFAVGAIHEFIVHRPEDTAATWGFITAIISQLMEKAGVALWISSKRTLFPTAVLHFGIDPDKIIFIDLNNERDCLWATEEALKCEGLAAVVCESDEFSFTTSRRLQLAVEKSGVTGFVVRQAAKRMNTTVSIARWKISSLPGSKMNDMPGVGFPSWKVELLKVRNGKPGVWEFEYRNKQLIEVKPAASYFEERVRKVS